MIKLVLSDMDGTLIPFGQQETSERTRTAIHALLDAGIRFGPATGREPHEMPRFFQYDEACYQTGIYANGKIVKVDGEVVFSKPIDRMAAQRLLDVLRPLHNCFMLMYAPDGSEFCLLGASEEEVDEVLAETPLDLSGSLLDELPEEPLYTLDVIYGNALGTQEEAVRRLHAAIPEFDFVTPGPHVLDVLPRGWSKATTLDILLDHLGIQQDACAYFGDSDNDVTMLERLDSTYVVSNGSPLALGAARWHIGDAAHDAPARAMNELAQACGVLPA